MKARRGEDAALGKGVAVPELHELVLTDGATSILVEAANQQAAQKNSPARNHLQGQVVDKVRNPQNRAQVMLESVPLIDTSTQA